jgi:hypothetical protein
VQISSPRIHASAPALKPPVGGTATTAVPIRTNLYLLSRTDLGNDNAREEHYLSKALWSGIPIKLRTSLGKRRQHIGNQFKHGITSPTTYLSYTGRPP